MPWVESGSGFFFANSMSETARRLSMHPSFPGSSHLTSTPSSEIDVIVADPASGSLAPSRFRLAATRTPISRFLSFAYLFAPTTAFPAESATSMGCASNLSVQSCAFFCGGNSVSGPGRSRLAFELCLLFGYLRQVRMRQQPAHPIQKRGHRKQSHFS